MAIRRTTPDPDLNGEKRRGVPNTMSAWSAEKGIKETGYGTPHVDELWNVADLTVEVPRLIDRFNIPQNISNIGSKWGGTCENQRAKTYYFTSEDKDAMPGISRLSGAPTDVLKSVLSYDESLTQSICDSFAQDYICFGFEPPQECSELHSSMVKYDLILYQEP